ncbi:MAG: hypothetical protein ACREPA_04130 [Candidatus Dormibacteraceae bacterium]
MAGKRGRGRRDRGERGRRRESFEHNADELWRLWHDPLAVARHLVELLEARAPR